MTSSQTQTTSSRLSVISRHLEVPMYKVLVTRNLGPDAMAILQESSDIELVVWPEDRACERQWLIENIKGAHGLATTFQPTKLEAEVLEAAGSNLKVVSTMSVGYDHIPLSELVKRRIRLGYTPDVLTDAVADISLMLALMVTRNVRQITTIVQNGDWPNNPWSPFSFCGPQLSGGLVPDIQRNAVQQKSSTDQNGAVAGFLGFGRIAQAVVRRLIPFGVKKFIYAGNPSSRPGPSKDAELARQFSLPPDSISRVSVEELAARSDIVFILAPGGSETHHVVSYDFLSRMKRSAVLVNAARGTLVDSDALAQALKEERIWGAGLDVVEGEPNILADHPLVKEPRCIILPHVGSATYETRKAMAVLTARNVLAGVRGESMPMEFKLDS